MATDLETLVVSLEARIDKYQKAMDNALGVAQDRSKKITGVFGSMSTQLNSKFSSFGKDAFLGLVTGAVAPIAAVLGVGSAFSKAKEAMQAFATISDDAKASGLDPEFFQALAYQAKLGGVGVDQLTAALSEYNKNSGLAVVGRGRMVASLKALDPALLENIRNASTQEQRVRLLADALSKQTDSAKRAAIATAALGNDGAKLANVFVGGADQIDAIAVKAKALGLIVDNDMIAKGRELNDQFETTNEILDVKMKKALISLGPLLIWLTGLAGDLADVAGEIVDRLSNPISKQSSSDLEDRLKELSTTGGLQKSSGLLAPGAVHGNIFAMGADVGSPQAIGATQADAAKETANIMAELRARAIESLRQQLLAKPADSGDGTPTLPIPKNKYETATTSVEDQTAQLVAQKAALSGLNPLVNDYGAALDKARLVTELQNAALAAGIPLDAKTKANIDKVAQANVDASIAVQKLTEAQAETKQQMVDWFATAKSATQGFIDDLVQGKSAAEALGNVFNALGSKLLGLGLDTLFGTGQGANPFGIIGKALGFASGTANTGGSPGQPRGIVHGQEAVIPLPNGGKVPVDIRLPSLPSLAGRAASDNGKPTLQVVVTGANTDQQIYAMARQGASEVLDQYDRHKLPRRVNKILKDPKAVGGSR